MSFTIKNLGSCTLNSPMLETFQANKMNFTSDSKRMVYNVMINGDTTNNFSQTFELAGPREKIFFNPEEITSAIVTCGGLCPGLNDVIRSIVMESFYGYNSKKILGIRYGYNGLNPSKPYAPIELTPNMVRDIHMDGGTILGSSRGGTDNMEMLVDTLEKHSVRILYTIGGDGTLKGAHEIAELARKRRKKTAYT